MPRNIPIDDFEPDLSEEPYLSPELAARLREILTREQVLFTKCYRDPDKIRLIQDNLEELEDILAAQ